MRKSGLIILVIVAAIFSLWVFVFSDRWLEKRLESLWSSIVGAKVELDRFDFSLFDMHIKWERLQVTDPEDTWRNLFETGYCALNIASAPLFQKKFIIEEVTLLDLRLNTPRATDGRLEKKVRLPEKEGPGIGEKLRGILEKQLSKLPVFNIETLMQIIDVEALWESVAPQSPDKISALIEEYERFSARWDSRVRDLGIEDEISGIRDELVKIDVRGLKTIEQLRDALLRLDKISRRAEKSTDELKTMVGELEGDLSSFYRKRAELEGWIEEDIKRVQNAVKLPEVTLGNVAMLMFGREIVERVQKVLRIINKFRTISEKVSRYIPTKKVPPRLKGQDIRFIKYGKLPDLWIKRVSFSGYIQNNIRITGRIMDLTSEQGLTGLPTVLELAGQRDGDTSLLLKGSFDHRIDPVREILELDMRNIVLSNVRLTDFPLLPGSIEKGKLSMRGVLEFEGSDLQLNIALLMHDLSFAMPSRKGNASEIESKIFELTESIAQETSDIKIEAGLQIMEGETKFSVQSNLDSIVSSQINRLLKKDIEKVKAEIERRVKEVLEESKEQLEEVSKEVEDSITGKLDDLKRKMDILIKELEKKRKEIEKRIEEQTIGKEKRRLEEETKKKEEEVKKELQKGIDKLF